MKKVRIQKPDFRGFFQKVKNLKIEDLKARWKAKRERRARILEERRSTKLARKMAPVYRFMNWFSLVFHYLLACILNFFVYAISRHYIFKACDYMK